MSTKGYIVETGYINNYGWAPYIKFFHNHEEASAAYEQECRKHITDNNIRVEMWYGSKDKFGRITREQLAAWM